MIPNCAIFLFGLHTDRSEDGQLTFVSQEKNLT